MSVYFVFNTKKQPHSMDIAMSTGQLRLQELHHSFLPIFLIDETKEYFYYLDGDINYLNMSELKKNASIDKIYNWHFQTQRNNLFSAVLDWIEKEIHFGNEISLIRQVQSNNSDERLQYNCVYEEKHISLSEIAQCNEVKFDFNVAYKFHV